MKAIVNIDVQDVVEFTNSVAVDPLVGSGSFAGVDSARVNVCALDSPVVGDVHADDRHEHGVAGVSKLELGKKS